MHFVAFSTKVPCHSGYFLICYLHIKYLAHIMQAFNDPATDAVSMIGSLHPQHLFPYPSGRVSLIPQKFFHLNTPNIIKNLISLLLAQNPVT